MEDYRILEVMKDMKEVATNVTPVVFATDRPKSQPDKNKEFIVFKMPVMVYPKTIGTGYGLFSSFVRFEVYVADERGVENTKRMCEICQSLLNQFPFYKDGIKFYSPRVVAKGTDQHGFHFAWVQVTLLIS